MINMWTEKTPAGTYKYSERFDNKYTGKTVKVSITKPKDDPLTRRVMPSLLYEKYLEKHGHTEEKSKDIPFGDLMDKWLDFHEPGWKAGTYRAYKGARNAIPKELSGTLVSKLTAAMINRHLHKLHAEGWSNSKMSKHNGVMHMSLTFGIDAGYNIDEALPNKLRPKRHKADRDDFKYLTIDELHTVERQLIEHGGQEYAHVVFVQATTGLRIGEALALRLMDIDIEKSVVHVHRSYDETTSRYNPPKNGKSRDSYMLEAAKERLKFLLDARKKEGAQPDDLLFTTKRKYMMRYSNLRYALKHYVFIEGKTITSHIFRHTYITFLIDNGMRFHLIAHQVGHEDTRMVEQVYGHYTDKTDQQLRKALSEIELK